LQQQWQQQQPDPSLQLAGLSDSYQQLEPTAYSQEPMHHGGAGVRSHSAGPGQLHSGSPGGMLIAAQSTADLSTSNSRLPPQPPPMGYHAQNGPAPVYPPWLTQQRPQAADGAPQALMLSGGGRATPGAGGGRATPGAGGGRATSGAGGGRATLGPPGPAPQVVAPQQQPSRPSSATQAPLSTTIPAAVSPARHSMTRLNSPIRTPSPARASSPFRSVSPVPQQAPEALARANIYASGLNPRAGGSLSLPQAQFGQTTQRRAGGFSGTAPPLGHSVSPVRERASSPATGRASAPMPAQGQVHAVFPPRAPSPLPAGAVYAANPAAPSGHQASLSRPPRSLSPVQGRTRSSLEGATSMPAWLLRNSTPGPASRPSTRPGSAVAGPFAGAVPGASTPGAPPPAALTPGTATPQVPVAPPCALTSQRSVEKIRTSGRSVSPGPRRPQAGSPFGALPRRPPTFMYA